MARSMQNRREAAELPRFDATRPSASRISKFVQFMPLRPHFYRYMNKKCSRSP